MTKRMLIDATHAEETRVVVLDGSRLEDFDVETSTKRQLKGNIYLAKVVRVEPSLQAAFVEYGGNRHGFLAFAEIHPDYYQIPVADRQRLIAAELEQARLEEEQADLEMALENAASRRDEQPEITQPLAIEADILRGPEEPLASFDEAEVSVPVTPEYVASESVASEYVPESVGPENVLPEDVLPESATAQPSGSAPEPAPSESVASEAVALDGPRVEPTSAESEAPAASATVSTAAESVEDHSEQGEREVHSEQASAYVEPAADPFDTPAPFTDTVEEPEQAGSDDEPYSRDDMDTEESDAPPPETIGGDQDGGEERAERRSQPRFLRNYKIQEVIHRRQILLIQVVKEERGTKGAALTTYLSLAGRFSVLMPNSPRGGGISRKITSATDRRRLKEVMTELDIPKGMGLIVRTAGAQRPKPEIKRDCEYLLRLWDDIRDLTMKSVAPALIYEEASLIKRAIRDVYSRDIDEILVDGEEGWRAAHDFMRMLMPTHAKKVQLWRDPQPLFARGQVEAQLDAMLQPTVQLRSGGYLVINQTEALVAIDVNSGRSTRERNIEETALRTNLEAADEAARQLRLRDLAGLIVIDFIDMESKRHNAMVERRIKEGLKNDRARIQVGHISHFGLLEMSRQRLRPSLAEASFIACQHCGGTGHVRSTENAAIHVLRGIEEEGGKRRAAEVMVHVATSIALYLLNHKRDRLQEIEHRYGMRVIIAADDAQAGSDYRIERLRARAEGEIMPMAAPPGLPPLAAPLLQEADFEDEELSPADEEIQEEAPAARAEVESPAPAETAEEAAERGKRRRRRRRRGGRREDGSPSQADDIENGEDAEGPESEIAESPAEAVAPQEAAAPDESVVVEDAVDAEPTQAPAEAVPEAADGDDEARGRRRGRRGGRRKRRDGTEGETGTPSEAGNDQPELLPVYAGPTPADPFGGQAFDIFDVLEQAEQRAAAAVLAERPAEPVVTEPVAAAPIDAEPVELRPVDVAPEPMPEPEPVADALPEPAPPLVVAETPLETITPDWVAEEKPALVLVAAPEAVIETVVHAEPAAESDVAVLVAERPPEPSPEPVAEAVSGPVVQPVLVGDAPPAEKKRGWWRR
jgi:ribonuclease E